MADVTSTFGSLSSTESSNSPSGSTTIGAGLDDNLRMIEAHLAAWRDQTAWGILTLTTVAGTNTITATLATSGSVTFGPTALSAGMKFLLIPANTNTGATTLNITSPNGGSALGAKNVFSRGAACVGGELEQNVVYIVEYDGTQFNILGSFLLSGSLDLSAATLGRVKFSTAGNLIADAHTVDIYHEDSFTATLTGGTTAPTGTVYQTRIGNFVVMDIPQFTATSNATTKSLTGQSTATMRPATQKAGVCRVSDNGGTAVAGVFTVETTGVINIYPTVSGGNWTASGTFLMYAVSISYTVN